MPSGSTSTGRILGFLGFLGALCDSARRPAVLRRCAAIALAVGTLLSLVNQGDLLLAGRLDTAAALRIVANYLIPFVVANLGAMGGRASGPR